MSRVRTLVAVAFTLIMVVGCGETKESKTPLNITEIPPDIMAIAKKNLPDVNFTTAWKKANGTFEVQGKNKNGKIREIDIRPDGTIEEIE